MKDRPSRSHLSLQPKEKHRHDKNESGSAFIIGVLTFWMIIYAISMVGHINQTITKKIKAQMAADTAALAGARIMANNLSTIAWINDSRAMIHYYKVRYGADLAAAGVLALHKADLATYGENNDIVAGGEISDRNLLDISTLPPNSNAFFQNFSKTFEEFTELRQAPWQNAHPEHWDDSSAITGESRQILGQNAEEQLARIQHSIGIITKTMVEKEVYDKAAENGSNLSCFFPEFIMMPTPGFDRNITIQAIDSTQEEDGEIKEVSGWRMFNEEVDFSAKAIGDNQWDIAFTRGTHAVEANIKQDEDGIITVRYRENDEPTKTIIIDPENGTMTSVEDGVSIKHEDLDDGGVKITVTKNGKTNTYRYKIIDGEMWVYDDMTNQYIDPSQDSTEIDGVDIRVQNFNHINLGLGTLWLDRMHIDEFIIHFTNPVKIISTVYGFNARAENDEFIINGLSTRNADCRWKRAHHWYSQNDLVRHRLCPDGEGGQQWRYEIRKEGSYLGSELAQGNDVPYDRYSELQGKRWATGSTAKEAWDGEIFDLRTGMPILGEDQYRIVRNCWHPHDLNCPIQHDPITEKQWCTPVVGKANGRYHHPDGARVECSLCIDGKVSKPIGHLLSSGLIPDNSSTYPAQTQAIISMLQHYPRIMESIKRQPDTLNDMPPLVLKEEFFKFGITVGTFIGDSDSLGYAGSSNLGLRGEDDAFTSSRDGVFAFAAARAGFNNLNTGNYQFSFSDNLERLDWIDSEDNLYLADWEASLVPLKTQIRDEDIDADTSSDSGLTYLFRRLNSNNWREDFYGQNQRVNLRIDHFNFNDLSLQDLVQH